KPQFKLRERLEALHVFIGELSECAPKNGVSVHLACARSALSACRKAKALCWSAVGIDVDGMLRRIAGRDPYVAMQLSVQRAFGLHVAEVLGLKPHDADRRDCLIVEGDRGKRRIPI